MLLTNHRRLLRLALAPLLAVTLVTTALPPFALADRHDERGYDDRRYDDRRGDGYNDEYIFAATRGVNEMDAPPAVKITLIPLTILLDLAFLPFAAVAGLFG